MARDKWVILGLGNPGPPYAHNRHNVGYWCINRLARLHGINLKARALAAIGDGNIGEVPVVLVKPRTFVNNSGHAAAAVLRHAGVPAERMLVICDDLDLPPGKLRLKPGGGHGGHKGLRSIIGAIGTGSFPRLRIGIGRPQVDGKPTWDPNVIAVWVLSDPSDEEAGLLHQAVTRAAEAVQTLITEGLEAAMNRYNR